VIDYQTLKLVHRHGDAWVPMAEVSHHGAAEHDIERTLVRQGTFRCTQCDEEVAIAPGDRADAESERS